MRLAVKTFLRNDKVAIQQIMDGARKANVIYTPFPHAGRGLTSRATLQKIQLEKNAREAVEVELEAERKRSDMLYEELGELWQC